MIDISSKFSTLRYAMHFRGEAGVRGEWIIVHLPGSSRGALASLQALFPGLLHIFPMMKGKGHGKKHAK